jgi:DNA-binding MarR family transcriptional regulator
MNTERRAQHQSEQYQRDMTKPGSRTTEEETERAADPDEIMLGVLSAIDRDSHISQRSISRELGVALGLANAYLKRCVTKGLVKIQQVPQRRYAYYLTPSGFSEKARLTGQYLSASFTFFRRAQEQMAALISASSKRGARRIALAGISELADVGILCASDHDVELIGIVDANASVTRYRGLDVRRSVDELGAFDVVIVTELKSPQMVYSALTEKIGAERVLAPRLLRLKTVEPVSPDAAAQVAAE